MKKHELIDDVQDRSFQFRIDGKAAKIDYKKTKNGEIALTHTEVPESLRGEGIGTELLESVLGKIEKDGLKVIPRCGFVIAYIREHPEWERIVLTGAI